MATVHHHHVGGGFAIAALFAVWAVLLTAMLRSCAAVIVNLPRHW